VGIDDFLGREVTKFEAAEKGEVTVLMFERAVGMEHRGLWFAARVDEEGFGEEGFGEVGIENGGLHADHARSGGRASSRDAQELATGEEAGGSTKGEDRAGLDESPSLQD
jgi:hypothetical protein